MSSRPAQMIPAAARDAGAHVRLFLTHHETSERRQQVLKEDQERSVERQQRLASQTSPLRAPDERIRIWERLHGLSLPRTPEHRLVGVIAARTALSLEEVRAEQLRRAAPVRAT